MKKIIAYLLCFSILLPLFPVLPSKAEDKLVLWRQTATMDINLNIIDGKTGKDDILLEINMPDNGKYTIEYFLHDEEKKTVEITNDPQHLLVDFMIEQGNNGNKTNKTKEEMKKYFLNVDYSGDIPVWKAHKDTELNRFIENDKLHYSIDKNASSKFPGVAFNINNKITMIKGDFNSNKLYLYLDKYQAGTIVPITLKTPDNKTENLQVLKNLNNFTTTPTHLVNEGGVDKDLDIVVVPNANNAEKAGSKPGIRVKFEQPKAIDENTWKFEYDKANDTLKKLSAVFTLKDLASEANMDIKFSLDKDGVKTINPLPEAGDVAEYKLENNVYQIDIVKDDTNLAGKNNIVRWQALDKSRIYKASLNFAKKQGDEVNLSFPPFTPSNEFAYTYMEFTLKRADRKEAYLEITPYNVGDSVDLEYTILYNKTFIGQLSENDNLWLKHYQKNDDAQAKINIPVPFNDNSVEDHYQVLFRFSSTNIRSQLINYQARNDKDVPPAMPNIVLVDNLHVTPPDQDANNQSNPSKIQFDLVWEAMDKAELDKALTAADDAVYYELSVNTLPGENPDNKYEVIKVYKVTKDNGSYKIEVHPALANDKWQGTPSETKPQYTKGYDKLDELFRIDGITLFEGDKWPLAHMAVYNEDQQSYTVTAQNDETKRIKDLSFPGVNYLRLRAYLQKNGKVTRSRLSLPHSFSMSMLSYEIPTVNNLNYTPIYKVKDEKSLGLGVTWDWNKNRTDFKTYKENMLDPLGKSVETIKYVGYISADRQKLMKIGVEDRTDRLTLLEGSNTGETSITVTEEELKGFRENKIYYFEVNDKNVSSGAVGGEFLTQIKGLDPNEVYYVRFVVEMQIKNKDNSQEQSNGQPKPRTSTPSVILEMTMPKLNPEPGDNEKLPLAPDNFKVDFVDNEKIQSYAEWEIPEAISPEQKNIGFELLNVEDQSLADELKENEFALEELVNGESTDEKKKKQIEKLGIHKSNVQAYRVVNFENGWQLQFYDTKEKQWKPAAQSDFSMEGRKIKVIDKKNSPNRVLYYYVRTVKYNDNKAAISRSRWREATLTTPELKRPINLNVDYYSTIDHNPKLERIIYFDVPLPEGVKLHDDYLVQIFVRGEKDFDFVETNKVQADGQIKYGSTYIKEGKGAPLNYQRLYYKVYGFDAGKAYDIKVRLEDRTKDMEKNPDGTLSYTTSPFSDVVRTRTEFDQAELDKENKYKEYLDVYRKQADELKKNPYFDLSTDGKNSIIKYRGAYADGELRNHRNGKYDLLQTSAEQITYYLPAEMIRSGLDTDLRLWVGKQQIVLPNGFVTEDDTMPIQDVLRKIKEYQGSVKDYSLKVTLTAGKYTSAIEGKMPLEPMVHISIQVVRETRTETFIDRMLEAAVENAINKNKVTLIQELEKELRYGIKEEKLNDIVNKVLVQVQRDFASSGQHQYLSLLQSQKDYITTLEREMQVLLTPTENISFRTYFRETSQWKELAMESDATVRSMKTGSFAAIRDELGQKITDSVGKTVVDEIRKYRLEKVFQPQEILQNGSITGEQLIRSTARILGAGDSNDTESYLKAKGITVPKINRNGNINKEQAYYLLAQAYAQKRNVSLKKVRITDYNGMEDYAEVDKKLQKDLLAAYHLKVFSLRNGKFSPKASFTMAELREFLRKL